MSLTLKLLVLAALLLGLAVVGAGWKWHGPPADSTTISFHPDGWTWD